MRVEPGFDPALGFVLETGVWRHTGHFDVFPRPHVLGIRQLEFSLLSWEGVTHLDGSPSHSLYEVTPLGAIFESGDQFLVNLKRLRSEEHTSELQSHSDLVCRLLLEKKKQNISTPD